MLSKKDSGIKLLEEALSNLENPKKSLLISIQILNRASKLLNIEKLEIWTQIQLEDIKYISKISSWFDCYWAHDKDKSNENRTN